MPKKFLIGVNYWPATKFINMWREFNVELIEEDFSKAKSYGLNLIRFFLTWDDFQSSPGSIDAAQLNNLNRLLSVADRLNMKVIPTLIVGHMSASNWLPDWMDSGEIGHSQWPIFYNRQPRRSLPKSLYTDPTVIEAQKLLITSVITAVRGHQSIWAWDISNEMDNIEKPSARDAITWQRNIVATIKQVDSDASVIHGTHIPQIDGYGFPLEALALGDVISLHTYPMYNDKEPTDLQQVQKNLDVVNRTDKPVLIGEFGVPTHPKLGDKPILPPKIRLVSEEEQAAYILSVVQKAYDNNCLGALVWCWSDYDPSLYQDHPFVVETHERYFGLFRADGSPKPVVKKIYKFSKENLY